VKAVAGLHDGFVHLESEVGNGTSVTVNLPMSRLRPLREVAERSVA
jgi:signal transduction histidine kinase